MIFTQSNRLLAQCRLWPTATFLTSSLPIEKWSYGLTYVPSSYASAISLFYLFLQHYFVPFHSLILWLKVINDVSKLCSQPVKTIIRLTTRLMTCAALFWDDAKCHSALRCFIFYLCCCEPWLMMQDFIYSIHLWPILPYAQPFPKVQGHVLSGISSIL